MNWKELDRKLNEFQKTSTVASKDVVVDKDSQWKNNTETVERLIEGKLAEDVRKRVLAPVDAPVVIVEVTLQYWISAHTAEHDYQMIIKCNGMEQEFDRYSAHENFKKLLEWLDEEPYEGEY